MKQQNQIKWALVLNFFCFCHAFFSQTADFTAVRADGSAITPLNNFICNIDSIRFTNTSTGAPTAYEWSFPTGSNLAFNGQNPPKVKFSPNNDQLINVVLTVNYGAVTSTKTLTIRVLINPTASFYIETLNQIVPASVTFVNNSINYNVVNQWAFGDGNIQIGGETASNTYLAPGAYPVKLLVSKLGVCFDSITQIMNIENEATIKMPNIFTPDNDENNLNELFRPYVNVGIKSLNCNIYDRWGNLVYSWEGVKGYWDGYNSGGQPCVDGTYFYTIDAISEDNKPIKTFGYVQLVR
jgi:gliding motility-associated-like protein